MTANTTNHNDITHAALLLDIYVHNTESIYKNYIEPTIKDATAAIKAGAMVDITAKVAAAVNAGVIFTRRYEHTTPGAADIAAVEQSLTAYIIEAAQSNAIAA